MNTPANMASPLAVIAAARAWIGTPYLHQASAQGAGADCLGLARGVWRALHGPEPVPVPPYSRDWGEVGAREVLLEAARRLLIEVPLTDAGPGTLVLFRIVAQAPAKHCGILGAAMLRPSFIHAHEGAGVIEQPLSEAWVRRAAYAFLYPAEA